MHLLIRNVVATGNIMASKTPTQLTLWNQTKFADNSSLIGTFDQNYFLSSMFEGLTIGTIYATDQSASLLTSVTDLAHWSAQSGQDKRSSTGPAACTNPVTTSWGGNLQPYSAQNPAGARVSSSNNNQVATWDVSGTVPGGALKIAFPTSNASVYTHVESPISAPLAAGKSYIAKFSTYGTTPDGILRVFLRKWNGDAKQIVDFQTHSFGNGRLDHEYVFTLPSSFAGEVTDFSQEIAFDIEIQQSSGTTYLNNLSLYPANLNSDPNHFRFEYNATAAVKVVTLDVPYVDASGTVYQGSVSLNPFTSLLLMKQAALPCSQ
jgi:hypothetical protein